MKKITLLFLFLSLYSVAQLPSNLPAVGLIAWYPFNGNANDESGFANHASVGSSVIPTTDRFGIQNAAYLFSGNTQIIIPSSTYTPFDSSFSISLWFKSTHPFREQPININDGNLYTSNLNFAFNNSGGNFVFWNSQGANNIVSGSTGEYTDGYWHNMVFLRADSIVKIYFDGIFSGSKVYKLPIGNNSPISLSNGSYAWQGALDDLAIYNRALTQLEIDSLIDITNEAITINAPIKTDAFPVGYPDTIRWTSQFLIDTVTIEYSIDGGNSWQLIQDSVKSNLLSYIWITPNLPGSTCIIKVSDSNNPATFNLSAPFLISRYKWELVTNAAPFSIRDGAGAYSYNDSMYLVGGWNPTDPVNYPVATNNEVWRSADGLNWSLISSGPWQPRHTFGHLVFNNKMWIVGGDELQNTWQKDVWNSTDGVNWTLLSDSVPWGERMTHMTCVYDNKLWVMGGQKIVGWSNVVDTAYNDVWNSVDGINWTQVTPSAAWSPRAQIQGEVVFDNKMWILGGGTYNGIRNFYNDVWNSTDGITWNLVTANAPWAPRQYHDVIVYDSAMWVMDGYDAVNGNRNDVWYSYNGVDWHNLKGTPWPPRHASSLLNYDESIWLVAGNLWNDVWRLNNIVCVPIALQPLDINLFNGDTATFVVASGSANSVFQWQIDSAGTWQNVSNTGQFTGANSAMLQVLNCTQSNDSTRFRCIVTKGLCVDTSAIANLWIASDLGFNSAVSIENTIQVFPNPASDYLTLKVNKELLYERYQLVDMYGKTVVSGKIMFDNFRLNTTGLSNGLYLLKIGTQANKKIEIHQ